MQWGVSTTSFPISVSAVYSIIAAKKDTSANSVPDVRNYSSTGFAYYGPSPYAWFAVCKAQQWGYTTSYNDVTVNFPVAYSTQIFCLTAFHSAPGVSTLDVYARHVMLNGFTFTVAAPDSAFTSFERAYWLSIGIQTQWGNAGSNNGSVDVTFPISFTKAVYQIQLTYNNSSYENPTYEIKDTKSFSYWSKYGGDKLWLAIGVQQWGYCNNSSQISFPMAYKTKCYAITFGIHYNGSQYGYNQVVSYNTLGFTMYQTVGTNGLAIMWIALGVQQWGLSDNIQRQTITFPISFPKICYHITWTATSSAGNPYKTSGYVNSVTNISFLAKADDTACQKYWFAVGV